MSKDLFTEANPGYNYRQCQLKLEEQEKRIQELSSKESSQRTEIEKLHQENNELKLNIIDLEQIADHRCPNCFQLEIIIKERDRELKITKQRIEKALEHCKTQRPNEVSSELIIEILEGTQPSCPNGKKLDQEERQIESTSAYMNSVQDTTLREKED